jgi:hypothetical protein
MKRKVQRKKVIRKKKKTQKSRRQRGGSLASLMLGPLGKKVQAVIDETTNKTFKVIKDIVEKQKQNA